MFLVSNDFYDTSRCTLCYFSIVNFFIKFMDFIWKASDIFLACFRAFNILYSLSSFKLLNLVSLLMLPLAAIRSAMAFSPTWIYIWFFYWSGKNINCWFLLEYLISLDFARSCSVPSFGVYLPSPLIIDNRRIILISNS